MSPVGIRTGGWKRQMSGQTVDATDWPRDDVHPFHPFGARSKQILLCPDPAPYDFLIPGHRYMLKFANPRAPSQFWSEIIAYRLGCMMGIDVPPAFAAVDAHEGQPAALIEFFFGPPGNPGASEFVHGGDYCVRYEPSYERVKGTDHTVELLLMIAERERENGLVSDPIEVWAGYFLFDALIGNTDRHQDNWGILWHDTIAPNPRQGVYAPAFDNGTSLGYNLTEAGLFAHCEPQRLERYVQRGRHHIRWLRGDADTCGHLELVQRWLQTFPAARPTFEHCLALEMEQVRVMVEELRHYESSVPFTEYRSNFVLAVIGYRLHSLIGIVGERA